MDIEPNEHIADKIAYAIEDGGPSPGADWLARMRQRYEVQTNKELLSLFLPPGVDAEKYLDEHWEHQLRRWGKRGKDRC